MKILIYCFLALLVQPVFSQQQSDVKVAGDNNVIQIIQGNNRISYDLRNRKDNEKLIKYMNSLPEFTKDMRSMLGKNNELLLKLVSNKNQNTITSANFFEELHKLSLENSKLREEITKLKKETKDAELSQILDKARKLLDQFDNVGYQQLLEQFKQRRKETLQKELAQVSYLQAQNNRNNTLYDKALEQIDQALSYSPDNPDYLSEKAKIYFDQNDFDKALSFFGKVLVLREAANPQDTALASLYNYMSVANLSKDRNLEALSYAQKAMALLDKLPNHLNPDLALTYNNMGMAHVHLKNQSEALYFLLKAAEIYERTSAVSTDAVINFGNLGVFHRDKKDYACALEYYFKALAVREKISGKSSTSTADVYNTIAEAYAALNHTQLAIDYYQKVIASYEAAKGVDTPDLKDVYYETGLLYNKLKNYTPAVNLLLKTARIEEQTLGGQHKNTIITYQDIADVYYNADNYKESVIYYTKVLSAKEKSSKDDYMDMAGIYFNLGYAYVQVKNTPEAIPLFKKILSVQKKLPESGQLYITLANFGLLYANMENGQYNLSQENMKKNWKSYESFFVETNQDIIEMNDIYFILCILNNKRDEARQFIKTNKTSIVGIKDQVEMMIEAGEESFDHKHYQATANAFEYVLELLDEQKAEPDDDKRINAYRFLAQAYCNLGKKNKALPLFEKVIAESLTTDKNYPALMDQYENCKK